MTTLKSTPPPGGEVGVVGSATRLKLLRIKTVASELVTHRVRNICGVIFYLVEASENREFTVFCRVVNPERERLMAQQHISNKERWGAGVQKAVSMTGCLSSTSLSIVLKIKGR